MRNERICAKCLVEGLVHSELIVTEGLEQGQKDFTYIKNATF